MRPSIYEPKGKPKEYDELIKSLRLCASDKRGSGCAKECTYGKKHPLNWLCMNYLFEEAADAIEELLAKQNTDGSNSNPC